METTLSNPFVHPNCYFIQILVLSIQDLPKVYLKPYRGKLDRPLRDTVPTRIPQQEKQFRTGESRNSRLRPTHLYLPVSTNIQVY